MFARGAAERPLPPAAAGLCPPAAGADAGGRGHERGRRAPGLACRVLGQPEDPALSPLLDELAAPGDSTEVQLDPADGARAAHLVPAAPAEAAADDRQWAAWVGRKRDKSGGVHFVWPNALRALSHDAPGGSGGLQKQTLFSFCRPDAGADPAAVCGGLLRRVHADAGAAQ